MTTVEDVINSFRNTNLSPKGVSFQGQSLKLNTADDAKVIVDAINNCKDLEFLNLEGNTLGVDAAEAIAKALETQSKFKRALWKDMFTGRMKSEIPKALEYLGRGLVKAGAYLTELDLSDNAFGPLGIQGVVSFLRSSSCYALEELRLHNNGLGITGGKLLADALIDCYESSKAAGKPLALRVFIAGRNRLENEGAIALARTLGTLEEIVMLQNGIYHVGISALSEAFTYNKNLQILNLNDNTIGCKGAIAISKVLPTLPKLKQINFGDCLLKTKGALSLASGLENTNELEELILDSNEIQIEGGLVLLDAISNKKNLRSLILDGNYFSTSQRVQIETKLKQIGKFNVLGSLDECVSEAEEEGDSGTEDDSKHGSGEDESTLESSIIKDTSVGDFINNPSSINFIGLGSNPENLFTAEIEEHKDSYLEYTLPLLMKISALTINTQEDIAKRALKCTDLFYNQLFSWTDGSDSMSLTNNALLVHLGLLKSEEKNFKPTWDIKGCLYALEKLIGKDYFPNATKELLRVFVRKDMEKNIDLIEAKKSLINLLG